MTKKKGKKSKKKTTDFKPGNKPYYEYDGIMLNAGVPWDKLIQQLQAYGCSTEAIADYAECSAQVIEQILEKNYEDLYFRSGARIITLHDRYVASNDESS